MRLIDPIIAELIQESATTRRFLEAMPADQSGFRPHEKSMPAGRLAIHIATIPGVLADMVVPDEYNLSGENTLQDEPTREAILEAFDKSLAHALEVLESFDDAKVMGNWTFKMHGKTIMTMPRTGFFRYWIMNHLCHHRGQFGVYLRLMGAVVPSSYGPTVDENFMDRMQEPAAKP